MFLIRILYYKLFLNYKIIYFPEESDSFIANFLIILPQRMGFNAIYHIDNKKFFSKKNILHFLKNFFIFIILGIPLIFIKILKSYLYQKKN
jgi:hypothetical protein